MNFLIVCLFGFQIEHHCIAFIFNSLIIAKARAIIFLVWTVSSSLFNQFSGSGSRLSPLTTPPCERSPHMTLSLQEILIVGSAVEQAKFSELTMDMFRWVKLHFLWTSWQSSSSRMLQTLEREPQESFHGLSGGHPMTHGGPHGTLNPPPINPLQLKKYDFRCKSSCQSNARLCAWFKGLYRKWW